MAGSALSDRESALILDAVRAAMRHAMNGGTVRARAKATGKEYAVLKFLAPCEAVPHMLVKLDKPFGNHRLSEVDFILLPNNQSSDDREKGYNEHTN